MFLHNFRTMLNMQRITHRWQSKMLQELLKTNWLMQLIIISKDNWLSKKTFWTPWEIVQSALVATQHAMMFAQDMLDPNTLKIALAHHIAIHVWRIQFGSLQEIALWTLTKLSKPNMVMLMSFHTKISRAFHNL